MLRAALVLSVLLCPALGAACPAGTVPFPDGECDSFAEATEAATRFLRENMPAFDRANEATLFDGGIVEPTVNISLAVKANTTAFPWAAGVSRSAFNDYVLPYANVNEARNNWRPLLYRLLAPLVAGDNVTTLEDAADAINAGMWKALGREDKPIVFKSEQTPLIYDPMSTIVYGFASCTGVSILYVDALRSVGIPARVVGTPAWNGKESNGNHNWVEVLLEGGWSFNEAAPAGPGEKFGTPCDKWFCTKAKFVAGAAPANATEVFAAKFSQTGKTRFPMAWDLQNKDVPGIDRSAYYAATCSKC
jgi:hypothetical protein